MSNSKPSWYIQEYQAVYKGTLISVFRKGSSWIWRVYGSDSIDGAPCDKLWQAQAAAIRHLDG